MDDPLVIRLPLVLGDLLVRRVGPRDHGALYEYWSDPDHSRFQLWGPPTSAQVRSLLDEQAEVSAGDPGVPLYLATEVGGRIVGDCQLSVTSVEARQAEIGFQFNPQFSGRGWATRSVTAVLGFGFTQLGLHRIEACTDVRNERSWRLMERVGMRREGHFVHGSYVRDEWVDDYLYAMLDEEWRQRHSALMGAVSLFGR